MEEKNELIQENTEKNTTVTVPTDKDTENNNEGSTIGDDSKDNIEEKGIDELKEKSESEYEKINKTYGKIYTIVFKYGILILVLIAAIIIFSLLIKKDVILDKNTSESSNEAQNLIQMKEHKKDIEFEDINMIINGGDLQINENILISHNNLIKFKGLIMPRTTFLYDFNTLKGLDYFLGNESDEEGNGGVGNTGEITGYNGGDGQPYEISELENFVKNTIYIDYNEIDRGGDSNIVSLPLNNNRIEDTFFVSCANEFRLFNSVCNHYIENFLDTFFVYQVERDLLGLEQTLKNLIQKNKYRDKACESFKNYIIYSNNAPIELEDIATICGGEYKSSYDIIQSYNTINSSLENGFINLKVSGNKDLNDYELISYQQIIYNDIKNGIINAGRFNIYTNLIGALLQSENSINNIYLDLTYRFNNIYIIPSLNKLKYQSIGKKEEIESIIAKVDKLNNGDQISGYKGLKERLINNTLIDEVAKAQLANEGNGDLDSTMNNLLKSIKDLTYIKVIKDEIIDNTIKINGYLSINIKGEDEPVYFGCTLTNKKGSLIINEINISEYEDLNNILSIIISQKDYSIAEIYEYIQKNISVYASSALDSTTCNLIKSRLEKLGLENKLLYCSPEKINILMGGAKSGGIYYQLALDNYNIKEIKVSNKDIEKDLKNFSYETNSVTIPDTISYIVSYRHEKGDDTLSGDNNIIQAISDFKKYLGVTPTDIAGLNGKIIVEFTLNGINLIARYDTDTKKIGPLYLNKDIDENTPSLNFRGSDSVKSENAFKNFILYLKENNQNEINQFLIETESYLTKLNPNLMKEYLKGN